MSCQQVARVLLFDDDTIRGWYELFERSGLEGLSRFDMGGSSGKMSFEQTEALKAWVEATLPRSTRQVGAWIEKEFGLVYESRSGLIALLHRLGLEYHKPAVISRKLDEKTQKAFIAAYENTLNSMGDDEVVVFVDAVHPTHAARPVGCWAPREQKLAIEQTSGRERINIHGAIDLETGQTRMIQAQTIDAMSTIRLLESLQSLYPLMACAKARPNIRRGPITQLSRSEIPRIFVLRKTCGNSSYRTFASGGYIIRIRPRAMGIEVVPTDSCVMVRTMPGATFPSRTPRAIAKKIQSVR